MRKYKGHAKEIVSAVLTLTLAFGLVISANAFDARDAEKAPTSVEAWDAYRAFEDLRPMTDPEIRMQGSFTFLLGRFLLDFDGDGVPELVTRHGKEQFSPSYAVSEDECIVIWRYNGASVERLTNYPASAQWDGATADTLYTSIGGSGGTFCAIVAFSDGTYGLRSRTQNYGYSQERTAALVNGKLQPTNENGTEIFLLGSSNSFPAERIFPTPTKPEETKPVAYDRDQVMTIHSQSTDRSWTVRFQTYAIVEGSGETNYIRVRDLAMELGDTSAAFEVTWDGAVNLHPGQTYTPLGSEGDPPFSGPKTYTVPQGGTLVDGEKYDLSSILLQDDAGNGYTYYKLRDLADALGFTVEWDPLLDIPITLHIP